jgi:hypothetical protein
VVRQIQQLVGAEIGCRHAMQHLLIGRIGRRGRASIISVRIEFPHQRVLPGYYIFIASKNGEGYFFIFIYINFNSLSDCRNKYRYRGIGISYDRKM